MSDNSPQSAPVINDTDELHAPNALQPLIHRIKELSIQHTTSWMQVEIAAIATLLEDDGITAGQIWQLVLSQYNIASSVSSTPHAGNDPNWLVLPLADRALVWEHLVVLCMNQDLSPVLAMPGPYDEDRPETAVLIKQVLDFLMRGLNQLEPRSHITGEAVLSQLGHRLNHDIRHHLAVQWFGGPHAIGASLHALPLPGGSFGPDDQPVYVLKALVEVLKRTIMDYEAESLVDQDSLLSRELLGRIELWWYILKGYTYDMVHTTQGKIVVAILVEHPDLVEDLKMVLVRGRDVGANSGQPAIPAWGASNSCQMQRQIADTHTVELVTLLDQRIATAQDENEQRAHFHR